DYTADGNLLAMQLPDGSTRQWTYTLSRPASYIDEDGHWTVYDVDPDNGNVRSVREVVGQIDDETNGEHDDLVTTYTYTDDPDFLNDPNAINDIRGGMLQLVTDPRDKQTVYSYGLDPSLADYGLVTAVHYAVASSVQEDVDYEYDAAGNLIWTEDS